MLTLNGVKVTLQSRAYGSTHNLPVGERKIDEDQLQAQAIIPSAKAINYAVCVDSVRPLYGCCSMWHISPAGKCTDKVATFKLDEKRVEVYTRTPSDIGDFILADFEDDSKEINMYQYLFLRQGDGKAFAAKRSAKLTSSMGKLLVKITYHDPPTSQMEWGIPVSNTNEISTSDTANQAISDTGLEDAGVANSKKNYVSLHYVFHFEYRDPYGIENFNERKVFDRTFNLSNFIPISRPATQSYGNNRLSFSRPMTPFHRDSIRTPSRHFTPIPVPSLRRGSTVRAATVDIDHEEIRGSRLRSSSDVSFGLESDNNSEGRFSSEGDSGMGQHDLEDLERRQTNLRMIKKELRRVEEKYHRLCRLYKDVSRSCTVADKQYRGLSKARHDSLGMFSTKSNWSQRSQRRGSLISEMRERASSSMVL